MGRASTSTLSSLSDVRRAPLRQDECDSETQSCVLLSIVVLHIVLLATLGATYHTGTVAGAGDVVCLTGVGTGGSTASPPWLTSRQRRPEGIKVNGPVVADG